MPLSQLVERVMEALWDILKELQIQDPRWQIEPDTIQLIVNPNGPLVNGGSDGDNGQTGRKLVMDFFGPRVPIGGGALYGKHPSHIDRLATFAAHQVCVDLLQHKCQTETDSIQEVSLMAAYAPGVSEPLDIRLSSPIRPKSDLRHELSLHEMRSRSNINLLQYGLEELGSFYGKFACTAA